MPMIHLRSASKISTPWMNRKFSSERSIALTGDGGKKEIYVLYNSFGGNNFDGKFENFALRDFVNPAERHYELHRVWVVEATVKAGMRHSAPKRTYYLDEDSWNYLAADDYDGQGKILESQRRLPDSYI